MIAYLVSANGWYGAAETAAEFAKAAERPLRDGYAAHLDVQWTRARLPSALRSA